MRQHTGRMLDRSIVLVGSVALLGNKTEIPDWWSGYLTDHPTVSYGLLIVVGVVGAFTPLESWAARGSEKARPRLQRMLLAGLGDFIELAERCVRPRVDLSDVGLHTWVVRRTLRHPISGVLRRTGTYRLGGNPLTVGTFAPTKGKGVVGLCWKYNRQRSCDVEALAGILTRPASFEVYRESHGGEAVMNFTWEEFNEVKHRGAVFAAPIRTGGRFVGCFSVDCRTGYDALVQGGLEEDLVAFAQRFDGRDLEIL